MADTRPSLGRYQPERAVPAPVPGRFEIAVDLEAGGRVTLFHPPRSTQSPQRFLALAKAEIARCAPLRDTGYCTIRDAGIGPDGEPYVVLDRPQGRTLATLLREQGHVRIELALAMLIDLSDLVERAHSLQILPVPVTLDSVLLQPRADGHYRVTLVDLALHRTPLRDVVPLPLRSSSFRSPQILAGAPPDVRDDVFALCAVLYLAIYGVQPPAMSLHGPSDGSGWPAAPTEAAVVDRRLEACVHTVLLKGLAPGREARFRDIAALRRALVGLRQLMRLSAAAFEVLAATRGRLGRRGPLDLPMDDPGLDRAAAAHARIQAVVRSPGGGSLSELDAHRRRRTTRARWAEEDAQ
jgi:hypothetical protein